MNSARGSVAQAIILYEAALGLGIAVGPLVGGVLGSISWRGPFFGVSALMAVALVVTALLLPPTPRAEHATTLADPFRALRHRGLLGVAITALLYNFGFFTLLAFTPFPLDMSAHQIGLIFFGWGLALAFTSVVVAPRLQHRFGTVNVLIVNLLAMTATLVVMALGTEHKAVLAACVVVAGLFIGINNMLITETVMKAAPVARGVASAAYSFMRFGGAASRRGWPACWASRSACTCHSGSVPQACCRRRRTRRYPSAPVRNRRRGNRTRRDHRPRGFVTVGSDS